jgi:carbamate kinase
MSILTQTLVDTSVLGKVEARIAIGPWFDRDKAEQHRQTRKWEMVEEPGRGYRRAVPSLPALEILEIEGIQHLVDEGDIVIAGGGGGIPVARNARGDLEGIEAVVETESLACMMAKQLRADILIMVVESDDKFILSGLSVESPTDLSLAELDNLLERSKFSSRSVSAKLRAASEFLRAGGKQVVITTLRKLPEALAKRGGLRIGIPHPSAAASEK